MTQRLQRTENKVVNWTSILRVRVGDVVTYNSVEWVNLTGKNGEPGSSSDWLLTDDVSEGIESVAIVSNISGTYNIDWEAADHWQLTMTANTTITESNIPPSGKVKTITIELSGNFSPTVPVAWATIGSTYDGTNGSQYVVQSWNNGSYRAVINDVI